MKIEICIDMPLRNYVAARMAIHAAADSPAEQRMAVLLARAAANAVYLSEHLVITIEPQKSILNNKYRLDWLVRIGERAYALEVDGFTYHSDQAAFQRDRQRDREANAAGFVPIRFTAKEVFEHPDQVEIELLRLFADWQR